MNPKRLIRVALTTSVLLFGATIYWFQNTGQLPAPSSAQETRPLLMVFGGLVFSCTTLLAFAFRQMQAATSAGQRQTWQVVAWAAGESTALFGGVIWLKSGTPTWYVIGVTLFLATLVIFRDRE